MMAFSSQNISGLHSNKVGFKVDDQTYQVEGYFSVKEDERDDKLETESSKWSQQDVKQSFEGWFVGENTGQGATRVSFPVSSSFLPS
jgi:hypothetical protein